MRDSLTIVIGGAAGQGLATVGELTAKLLAAAGYNFVTFQGYHSRVRGGHNTYAIKISPLPLTGPEDGADLVLSLNEETDVVDGPRLRPGGLLLAVGAEAAAPAGASAITVPYGDLSAPREQNLAALGLLAAALNLPIAQAAKELEDFFKNRGGAEKPLAALNAAYQWAKNNDVAGRFQTAPPAKPDGARLLINGNTALALGAAAGGINFCSFYPMSPATTVALSLADWAAGAGMVVEQAEDEIAAINMALGAAYAGASALVSTSGGGFALMCEGVSLSGMLEVPVVIVVVQRPGPATGLPTRTEQGDLNLVLYAGHGEFPRAIFAPGTAEECFRLAAWSAKIAEESQGPVFILSDQYLADCTQPLAPFDFNALPAPVNTLEIHKTNAAALAGQSYLRYNPDVPNGVSPRLLPGFSEHLVKVDSDEHTPDGHLTEDLECRVRLQDKRLKKLDVLKAQILPPARHGAKSPDILLVAWGSTLGAGLDALAELEKRGDKAALLHFTQLYPLAPDQWLPEMEKAGRVYFLESNAEGQFAQLVRRETGFSPYGRVNRYDGLPLTAAYILERLEVPDA